MADYILSGGHQSCDFSKHLPPRLSIYFQWHPPPAEIGHRIPGASQSFPIQVTVSRLSPFQLFLPRYHRIGLHMVLIFHSDHLLQSFQCPWLAITSLRSLPGPAYLSPAQREVGLLIYLHSLHWRPKPHLCPWAAPHQESASWPFSYQTVPILQAQLKSNLFHETAPNSPAHEDFSLWMSPVHVLSRHNLCI